MPINRAIRMIPAASGFTKFLFLFIFSFLRAGGGFLPGTLVKTQSEYLPIELLSVGDRVCNSHASGDLMLQPITFTQVNYLTQAICLRLSNNEELWLAPDQQLYDISKSQFIEAKDLAIGTSLAVTEAKNSATPELVYVAEKTIVDGSFAGYSIALEREPLFFVTKSGVCTHNTPSIFAGNDSAFLQLSSFLATAEAACVNAGGFVGVSPMVVGGAVGIFGAVGVAYYYRDPIGSGISTAINYAKRWFVGNKDQGDASSIDNNNGELLGQITRSDKATLGLSAQLDIAHMQNSAPKVREEFANVNSISVLPSRYEAGGGYYSETSNNSGSNYNWETSYNPQTGTLNVDFLPTNPESRDRALAGRDWVTQQEAAFDRMREMAGEEALITETAYITARPVVMPNNKIRLYRHGANHSIGYFYDFDPEKERFYFYAMKIKDDKTFTLTEKIINNDELGILKKVGKEASQFLISYESNNYSSTKDGCSRVFMQCSDGVWESVSLKTRKPVNYRIAFPGDSFVRDDFLWKRSSKMFDSTRFYIYDADGNLRGISNTGYSVDYNRTTWYLAPEATGPFVNWLLEAKKDNSDNIWRRFVFLNEKQKAAFSDWGVFDQDEKLIGMFSRTGVNLKLAMEEIKAQKKRAAERRKREGQNQQDSQDKKGGGNEPPPPPPRGPWDKLLKLSAYYTKIFGEMDDSHKMMLLGIGKVINDVFFHPIAWVALNASRILLESIGWIKTQLETLAWSMDNLSKIFFGGAAFGDAALMTREFSSGAIAKLDEMQQKYLKAFKELFNELVNKQLAAERQKNEDLQIKLAMQTQKNEDLQTKICEQKEELVAERQKNEYLQIKNEGLQINLAMQTQKNEDLQAKVCEQKEELINKDKELAKKDSKLDKKDEELAGMREFGLKAWQEVFNTNQKHEQLNAELKTKDKELAKMADDFASLEAKTHSLEPQKIQQTLVTREVASLTKFWEDSLAQGVLIFASCSRKREEALALSIQKINSDYAEKIAKAEEVLAKKEQSLQHYAEQVETRCYCQAKLEQQPRYIELSKEVVEQKAIIAQLHNECQSELACTREASLEQEDYAKRLLACIQQMYASVQELPQPVLNFILGSIKDQNVEDCEGATA